MKPILLELEGSVTCPLTPDPQVPMEADFMLPEFRQTDHSISTDQDFEDEFECDRCHSFDYRLTLGVPEHGIPPHVECLECGWTCPTVDAAIAVGTGRSLIRPENWVPCIGRLMDSGSMPTVTVRQIF